MGHYHDGQFVICHIFVCTLQNETATMKYSKLFMFVALPSREHSRSGLESLVELLIFDDELNRILDPLRTNAAGSNEVLQRESVLPQTGDKKTFRTMGSLGNAHSILRVLPGKLYEFHCQLGTPSIYCNLNNAMRQIYLQSR